MKKKVSYGLLLILILFVSCKQGAADADPRRSPVVTVKDQTLYKAALDDAIPRSLSVADSTAAARLYIDMWVMNKLLYDKAVQNVVNKDEIDQLVNDYRKSLMINSYQEQLVREHFNKAVTDKELLAYYEQNKDKIKLKESIIKGLFLKIPADSKELANFRKWYKQATDAAVENIEKNRLQSAVGYEYFYNNWVSLSSVIENMPLPVDDEGQFLKTNKSIEVRDSLFVYLLNIKDYKLAGSEAPFDYIKSQLAEIYVEQRRAGYLKQVRDDLFKKAVSDKEIKFYDK
jgi:hypothetical protein